jgi:predicted permease
MVSDLWIRLRALFRRKSVERELDDELRFHFEQKADKYARAGMTREEARRRTRLEFGGVDQVKEECRDARGVDLLESLGQDIRYALRMLRKSPGFTTVAVLTLALGIGANTAIFSVVEAALLRPLPYRDGGRLVTLWANYPHFGFSGPGTLCDPDYAQFERQNRVFSDMAAFRAVDSNLTGSGDPERLRGTTATSGLLPLLGANPEIGRVFSSAAQVAGHEHVVVLSQKFWARKFGADREILGKPITLDGESYTVIGVMPPGFGFPNQPDFWMPMVLTEDCSNATDQVVAHLIPGMALGRAQSDVATIADRLNRARGRDDTGQLGLVYVQDELSSQFQAALSLLLSAVGLVLLIACANIANLFLARATVRRTEMSVRRALGASRLRIVRLMLTESMLVAWLGGGLGLAFAALGHKACAALLPRTSGEIDSIGRTIAVAIDARVLWFTLIASLLTGILFGVAPALEGSRPEICSPLKEAATTQTAGARLRSLRNLLIVGEFALTLVLLVSAGLLLKSFVRLSSVDPGFNPQSVLSMTLELPGKYQTETQMKTFHDAAVARIEQSPGVIAAGTVFGLPFEFGGVAGDFSIVGQPAPPEGVIATKLVVSPGYFGALEIPLISGRLFKGTDSAASPRVAIVSRRFAERFWPHSSPLGHQLDPGFEKAPLYSIVGVVGDVKQHGLASQAPLAIYLPYSQGPRPFLLSSMTVVARTAGNPANFVEVIRRDIQSVDPDMPVFDVTSMEDLISQSVSSPRVNSILVGSFAAFALIVAAVGMFGVISYSVTQRTHEIGIRVALGGQPADILELVVGEGLRLAVVGVSLGLMAAFALTRLMSSLLFGVTSRDPLIFGGVALLLTAVALASCYIPARRAMRVDPVIALRYQ